MPTPSRPKPAPLPSVLGFRGAIDDSAKVDVAAGTMAGVACVTGNLKPGGWPMWVDDRTIATFAAVFGAAAPVKAYMTHEGGPEQDRQGEELGLFRNFRQEGSILRADFEALTAWRTHDVDEFDKLFELAQKAPASFGVSPIFTYTLAWRRTNGAEIPCQLAEWRWDESAADYVPVFEPSAPADSATPLPCCRVTSAISVDFTDMPATNPGLFSAHAGVDAPAKGNLAAAAPSPSATSSTTSAMTPSLHAQLFAKFRSNPAQFARACEIHESDAKLSVEQICGTVEREGTAAEIGQLRADLGARDTEIGTLREAVKTKDAELATLRAQAAKDAETIAAFRKGPAAGASPVATGTAGAEAGAATDPVAALRAEIEAVKGTDAESAAKRGALLAKLRKLEKAKK